MTLHRICQIPGEIVCVSLTLGLSHGSRNFCKLHSVSWEVFVLHWYHCVLWVAKSCTKTAHLWLVRDSPSSLRTLWSAVIRSPNFSARGTASPARFLQGALVILFLSQISQFLSFGKWVLVQCFLDTTLVGRSESESWEVFAGRPSLLALLYLRDFLWTPLTILGDLAIDYSLLDCCPCFYFCFLVFVGSPRFLDASEWVSSDGICVIDNRISSHFESNSWISSFRRTTVNRSA